MAKHFKTPEGVRAASQRTALSPCPRRPRRRTVAAGMTAPTSRPPVPPLMATITALMPVTGTNPSRRSPSAA